VTLCELRYLIKVHPPVRAAVFNDLNLKHAPFLIAAAQKGSIVIE